MDLNVSFFLVDDDVFLLYFALILFAFTPMEDGMGCGLYVCCGLSM